MKEAGSLTAWVLGYVVASQVGVVVIIKVAFGLSDGAVTNFTFADLLFQVPYGMLGVSLLTALMPRMSRSAARGDTAAVVADLSLGARLSAVALIPVTAGFIVLGPSLTTALFVGRMTVDEARLVGTTLAWAAFGLLPFAFVMLQLRVFYAMRDARTPTLVNICMVLAKIILVLLAREVLSGDAQVIALNVSTSLSYVVGAVLGHVLLTRRFGRLGFRSGGPDRLPDRHRGCYRRRSRMGRRIRRAPDRRFRPSRLVRCSHSRRDSRHRGVRDSGTGAAHLRALGHPRSAAAPAGSSAAGAPVRYVRAGISGAVRSLCRSTSSNFEDITT